jgi:maltoporin
MLAIAAALLALATPANAVDLHGYFRTGVGSTSNGGQQVDLKNSGQDYKLRLGNEDNWSEFEFVQPLLKDKNGVEWTAGFMLGWGDGWTNNIDLQKLSLQQEYIKGKFPQLGGATLWGGKRFYHRHANDIYDYFYLNYSGDGGGVGLEDYDVGFGKLNVAIFHETTSSSETVVGVDENGNATSVTGSPTEDASVGYWRPDVRLEGIPTNPDGTLNINVLARFRGANTKLGASNDGLEKTSYYIMAEHNQNNILGGNNTLAVWYRTSAFIDMAAPKKTSELGVSEALLLQPVPTFSVVLAGIYQAKKVSDVDKTSWSIAARPVFQINEYFKVQGDLGYFYAKTEGTKENTMVKGTIAPTISPAHDGNAWGIRPEVRFYVSYAAWNSEQNTATNNNHDAFGTDDSGMTFGTQVETWF